MADAKTHRRIVSSRFKSWEGFPRLSRDAGASLCGAAPALAAAPPGWGILALQGWVRPTRALDYAT